MKNKPVILGNSLHLLILLCLFAVVGCQTSAEPKAGEPAAKGESEKPVGQNAVTVTDTGQIYFKVVGTKNNKPFISYEGDFPTATQQDTFFTVGLGASRDVAVWSDMLSITIYIKHMATGSFPVVGMLYAVEGKATILLTSPKDWNASQPKEGTVTITKFSGSQFSGTFEGKSINQEGAEMGLSGVFLNVKYK